jgi:tetratricopeptide (TPR) repeat protein
MVSKYEELRDRYYGSHTYDFRWFILNNLAAEFGRSGDMADAEVLLTLNLEYFPDNPRVQTAHALASVESAMIDGGTDAGVARFRELEQQFPAGPATENQLNAMGYRLMANDLLPEATEIFKLNVEINPGSSNVYDSLGEAYMNAGDNELAIQNYERSLELDPDNTNAVQMLERLRAE